MAGFPVSYWVSLFKGSNSFIQGGIIFNSWPDGLSQLEQEEVTIQIFELIKDEWFKMLADKDK